MIFAMASKALHGMVILLGGALLPSCLIALLLHKLAKSLDKKSHFLIVITITRACITYTWWFLLGFALGCRGLECHTLLLLIILLFIFLLLLDQLFLFIILSSSVITSWKTCWGVDSLSVGLTSTVINVSNLLGKLLKNFIENWLYFTSSPSALSSFTMTCNRWNIFGTFSSSCILKLENFSWVLKSPATWQPWQNLLKLVGSFKERALAPVPWTGTKGWAFSPGRAAPAREPGQQALSDWC